MQILEQLGLALGLASLAGLNLYLTVFLTGMLVRFDVLHLATKYQAIEVLGHEWVLATAGVLYVIEFVADKVPWLDSAWDSLHTLIRPVGGTLLAMQALGEMPAHMEVVAALLAGGAALTTHSAKAGTRLLVNHSPEPVSNITLSIAEDITVAAGTLVMVMKPVLALCLFTIVLIVLWLVIPRLWSLIRRSFASITTKLRLLFGRTAAHYSMTSPGSSRA
ncbi:MAG: DUF4126 domain-containing protein [Prosthecobacter sp.]|jgi:hypothetical protein|uniref:DUF4126 domain-containing protein n=1 Tax=Prosthecobacter sp. TaxID=1965333 RepID=UPI0019DC7709|nr:DUF4126 domain-containing protein [Prosthecobacter sp.]MBE2283414.1 DUF4126 domain-containing protein [Prosthecobacter sp.]